MKRPPYLVQRLQKPFPKNEGQSKMMEALSNAFSFGGGLVNGGLSKEAMALLKDIWRYDYMGSAEFEFGAVPESLKHIAENIKDYVADRVEVTGKYHSYKQERDLVVKAPVYFLCKRADVTDVCTWIDKFADDNSKYHTKESVNLSGSICQIDYAKDNVGWHDIDNHFLFFTDKVMFENFIAIFGLKK